MRLDKLLEKKQFGSRNAVKKLIRSKQVTVNGKIVLKENLNVDPQLQEIVAQGRKIEHDTHVYFMLNKPQGIVTAKSDKQHQTVIDLLKPADQRLGIYSVGRLDRDTEGLIFLTDNGQLGYQLLLPEKKVAKTYEVWVNESLTEKDVKEFASGIVFHDGTICQPAELIILFTSEKESRALIKINEGKFHQIKKMFLSVGKKVIFLKRLSIGPIVLDEALKLGEYRALTPAELTALLPYFTHHQK